MQARMGRAGWSEAETAALMERARQAREQGRPLREVFEATAQSTGRRPNSIRNFYYAQNRDGERRARFTPFDAGEAEQLTEQILTARASGESVRACVTRLSGGDQRLMLRYQNKYRAMLRSRPDVVERVLERLRAQGLTPPSPYTTARPVDAALERVRRAGTGEKRVCDMLATLEALLDERAQAEHNARQLSETARPLLECVRGYMALPGEARDAGWGEFMCELVKRAAALEKALAAAAPAQDAESCAGS
ncbi:MAG TPA: hypothetical protein IAC59_05950 [Candidatus Fimadaptatus faecigallinarum]|uniref:Uncharacterized protein n=1 Tax=Candidatus Fimadaptatus faecigallinarum TaxID=2840814 RepID=A0A9D1LRS2_9FIRM|nr:hypothetical protein [Candidatus Fimadaptatus faecigallinarum]